MICRRYTTKKMLEIKLLALCHVFPFTVTIQYFFFFFYHRCLGPIARHAVDLVPMLKAICQISVDKLHLDEDVSNRSCAIASA